MDYSLIIKLTNNCNLNCSYCYHRRDQNRNMHLSLDRAKIELMIMQLLKHNEKHAEFIWHGGEPLLCGIDIFKFIVDKQKEHNTKGLEILNAVQTNGTLLDSDYIEFFESNNFSIGISIDGPFDMHTSERGTCVSEYEHILQSLDSLSNTNAKYGTLCVVGKQHIGQANRIFQMICEHKISNIGFLPCVVHTNGVINPHITIAPEEYAQFLIDLFDIWLKSNTRGLSIRNFDDCLRFFCEKALKTCISLNICDTYLTVTPDGGIYLCDNFCSSDKHIVGNISESFSTIEQSPAMQWLKESMRKYPDGCTACEFFKACHGGCKYYRWLADGSMNKRQYYCKALKLFYSHVKKYMIQEGKL